MSEIGHSCLKSDIRVWYWTPGSKIEYLSDYLIPIELTAVHLLLSLFLESDDNQSYEHIQEEERKNDNEADIVQGHLYLIVFDWSMILLGRVNSVMHAPGKRKKTPVARGVDNAIH